MISIRVASGKSADRYHSPREIALLGLPDSRGNRFVFACITNSL